MQKTHNKYKQILISSNHLLKFGTFGLKSKFYLRLPKQKNILLYALLKKKLKNIIQNHKEVKIWNCLIFNQNITKLSLESRMGKGKGSIYANTCFIKPGNILFEFKGINKEKLNKLSLVLSNQLGKKVILVSKHNN